MTPAKHKNKPLVSDGHNSFRSILLELLNSRTQQEVAELIGIRQPTLSMYLSEKRKSLPRRKRAREIAKCLRVDVEWFCRLTNPYNKTP